ncbi:RimK family alpha-L-glutamate ligase [Mycobacterium sp. SMC-4]|uniref:ATP-grasp domain-containing protein n=1 Tax=Mycobacterium sp. SMC-4 TaxID=2857059 RepID=UPI0021B16D27|nr:hypothetical protein [Mycobacterium sp. SMC-4]UXA20248.1 hypothetical protein KXD98_12140 [Mycobacterium sp. SMC-4]
MHLARPDLYHPRIVLAGCAALPEGDGDDEGLVHALRGRGLHARWMPWDDPATVDADLVILRATWDYVERLSEFRRWSTRVKRLLNPATVVAWNTDKRYLDDLAAAGIPTVPSAFYPPGHAVVIADLPDGEVVVKPAVGAGSRGALRFDDAKQALAHAEGLQRAGHTALVQPYDPRVVDGETALVFLRGEQSHAFTKGPMLSAHGHPPDLDRSGTFARESLAVADPDLAVWDLGHAALAATAALLKLHVADLLYARVDILGTGASAVLLELELVEPSLGWRQLDETTRAAQQRQFALAVESALHDFGLGPFSHRRP